MPRVVTLRPPVLATVEGNSDMALSDERSQPAARAKELGDRAASSREKAKADLEQDARSARASAQALKLLEGRQVNVTLRDGTRIDDCNLVSSGRNRLDTLWLFIDGEDVFVARSDVIEVSTTVDTPWAA